MKNRALTHAAILCTLLATTGIARAQSTNQVTAPFSDPARPGTVKVSVISSSIAVHAGSGRDVIVTTTARQRGDSSNTLRDVPGRDVIVAPRQRGDSDPDQRRDNPPTDGLRRLTQPAGLQVEEENNIMTISMPPFGRSHLDLQVPEATSVVLRAVNGGDVTIEGVNGNIEVTNINGSIALTNVGGAIIAHATNGKVVATLRQVAADKPMAFTSLNGNVDVTLPASTKADLKLRSDRGDVYTDFDVQTTEAPPAAAANSGSGASARRDRSRDRDRNPRFRLDIDRSIYGTINGGGPDFELRTFNGNIYLRKAN
jgi:hypothetical protein